MAFVKTTTKEVLSNIQQSVCIPFHTIHDECDYVVSEHLLEPILTVLSEIVAKRDIFDKIGKPYINYLADCEFDKKGQTFLPNNSFNPYQAPKTETEAKAQQRAKESYTSPEVMEIEAESVKEFRNAITYDNDGVFVTLHCGGRKIESQKPINKESILEVIKSGKARDITDRGAG